MRIREEGREERSAPVLVAVSIESDAQSSVPRNLMCFQVGVLFCLCLGPQSPNAVYTVI